MPTGQGVGRPSTERVAEEKAVMARVITEGLKIAETERLLIAEALKYSETLQDAADKLGIRESALRRRMKKYALTRPEPVRARRKRQ